MNTPDTGPEPAMIVVERLLQEAGGDIAVALYLAATTILGLSSSASYGMVRAVPYEQLMPPKTPAPPPVE